MVQSCSMLERTSSRQMHQHTRTHWTNKSPIDAQSGNNTNWDLTNLNRPHRQCEICVWTETCTLTPTARHTESKTTHQSTLRLRDRATQGTHVTHKVPKVANAPNIAPKNQNAQQSIYSYYIAHVQSRYTGRSSYTVKHSSAIPKDNQNYIWAGWKWECRN